MINYRIVGNWPEIGEVDLTDASEEIGLHMVNSVQRNFQAGGRPDAWLPLKRTGKPSFLYKTGRLFKSIQRAVERVGDSYVITVWPGTIYARKHQTGYAPQNIPPRPYLVMQEEDKNWVRSRVIRELAEQIGRSPKQ